MRAYAVLGLCAFLGCSADPSSPDTLGRVDAGAADLGVALDGGPIDSAIEDGAIGDGGTPDAALDAGTPLPVGAISGPCGELDDTELLGAGPFDFTNHLDLPMGYTAADLDRLSAGAQEILAEGTAGGSSGLSEAFSFEVLHRCEGAALVKSETEIIYDPITSKKTDILVEIDGHKIGVSVTRAVSFPRDAPYPVAQAYTLIERKLADILESSANVVPGDRWEKQILHVVAYGPEQADSVVLAAAMVDPATRADTILWITITDGDDAFIY